MIEKLFAIFKESTNSFEGQEVGEKVILLTRRFPLTASIRVSLILGSFLAPVIAGGIFYNILSLNNLLGLFWFAISLWVLVSWILAFYVLTMYTLDMWILTDRRIVDSTQQGLFNRTISELHLSRVQDTSVHIQGFLPAIFRYGDLTIQTAGAEEHFKFHEISHPEMVKDAIMKATSAHTPTSHP
ncbi:PH domain-containing protein [Candidatus Parcubacteria bacterium]|nr:PH domain-containing protein [Candidatus Parcubacteria bacterium]